MMNNARTKAYRSGICWLLLLMLLLQGCAGWRFVRAFRPLLEIDLRLNQQYQAFEASLPNDKHWSENVGLLDEIITKKKEIQDKLKLLSPPAEYKTVYDVFDEDLTNSMAYLKKETELIRQNTEYGLWLARSMLKGSIGHETSGAGIAKAKEEMLRLQEDLTALAERCNYSQDRLAQLVVGRQILREYKPIKYPQYKKGYVGYKTI